MLWAAKVARATPDELDYIKRGFRRGLIAGGLVFAVGLPFAVIAELLR